MRLGNKSGTKTTKTELLKIRFFKQVISNNENQYIYQQKSLNRFIHLYFHMTTLGQ